MGECFITRRGGGSALNLRVVGGAGRPTTARENDIWIETNAAITDWSISPTEPANKIEGMAWIYSAQNANCVLNLKVFRDSGVKLYPAYCSQWIGGAWTIKKMRVYMGGTWKEQYSQILSDNSWEEIARAVASGVAQSFWRIGDTKDMTLVTGEVLTMQIYDFAHDDLADGSGKSGITFGMKNLMRETHRMNSIATNLGSFVASEMFKWLNETVYRQIPAEVRAIIKTVNKVTGVGGHYNGAAGGAGGGSETQTDAMKIFTFSACEVFGIPYQPDGAIDGAKYPIFTDAASRTKRKDGGAGVWWCGRTPHPGNAVSFHGGANPDGTAHGGCIENGWADKQANVCFGFCI